MFTANTKRKFGSAGHYHGYVMRWCGKPTPLLFTDAALEDAARRAREQPEDAPKVRWWHRFLP